MNNHVHKWRKDVKEVQKVIDALPNQDDMTGELSKDNEQSHTLSDNKSQDHKSQKSDTTHNHEKPAFVPQEISQILES